MLLWTLTADQCGLGLLNARCAAAVALETGGVLGLPKMLIDPRRPEVMSPEARC